MRRVAGTTDYGIAPPRFRLADDVRLGRIRLHVSDLPRSIEYYRNVLGLDVTPTNATAATLHARNGVEPLIELHQEPGIRPVPKSGVLGLFHFAILLPTRAALGQFIAHLVQTGTEFGAADHLVSEAIYLWDPDGLGIEVYADRTRQSWRLNGRELVMVTERLDLRPLMESAEGASWDGMPPGTTLGHMHLSVGDLVEARRFFHDALGLDLTVWSYPGALFLSAGGYHHHLGTNTWAAGARLATPRDARLFEWQLVLPNSEAVREAEESLRAAGYAARDGLVTDPWGTRLRLVA